jgi:starch-binding outer membrane protein, SusD/RagB family
MTYTLIMRRVCTAAIILTAGGCNWLKATDLTHNPNAPSTAQSGTLFIAAQADVYQQIEGQLGRTLCIWMQQCGGQASPFTNLNLYQYNSDDYLNNWSSIYGGGGLIDLRTIEKSSLATGDSIFAGQAIVLEAMQIGLGADIWGAIPYSQASQAPAIPTPVADSQHFVYDSILTALGTAVVYLNATGPTNAGALSYDNLWGGNPANWVALAETLRARFWMHLAARLGTVAYDSAFAAASLGITDPTGAGDFVSVHGSTAVTANLWSDFQSIYAGDIYAGGTIIAIQNATTDPRLPLYWTPVNGIYAGANVQVANPSNLASLSATRSAQTFGQPIVTYAENTLILAEASCQMGHGSTALGYLQAEQTAAGVTAVTTTISLNAIMTEKYVALFQNPEIWNDWKRTGLPALVPTTTLAIPRRLLYPQTERSANPKLPADPAVNWNDNGPVASNCG